MNPPLLEIPFWHLVLMSRQALLIMSRSMFSTSDLILFMSWGMVAGLGLNTFALRNPQAKKDLGPGFWLANPYPGWNPCP